MKPLLTVKQVADLLQLSRGTVARLVDTENLPAFVVCRGPGKRILRFREEEVEQWLAGRHERQILPPRWRILTALSSRQLRRLGTER